MTEVWLISMHTPYNCYLYADGLVKKRMKLSLNRYDINYILCVCVCDKKMHNEVGIE